MARDDKQVGTVRISEAHPESLAVALSGKHSEPLVVWTPEGDLIVGVYPQEETYETIAHGLAHPGYQETESPESQVWQLELEDQTVCTVEVESFSDLPVKVNGKTVLYRRHLEPKRETAFVDPKEAPIQRK